ncbi:unnamed protein product [Moneuplotes crassus]|uniref:Uncharacterized protein n=1 Tax=Euplotes crassus TaxID=5936 RepID=A0AAD1X534_EUPCR|nr:unnamed protein product [Moneuplotes crassus]
MIGSGAILQDSSIAGSFIIHSYVRFMTSNIYIVVTQNVLYSIVVRQRLKDAMNGFCTIAQWIVTLCISFHLTYSVNFKFVFETHTHTGFQQLLYILLFMFIHLVLVTVFIAHQSWFCGEYYSEIELSYLQLVKKIPDNFSGLDIENGRVPDCDYCFNNLLEPMLETPNEKQKQTSLYRKLCKCSQSYIDPGCPHKLHLGCYFICNTDMNGNEVLSFHKCCVCNKHNFRVY